MTYVLTHRSTPACKCCRQQGSGRKCHMRASFNLENVTRCEYPGPYLPLASGRLFWRQSLLHILRIRTQVGCLRRESQCCSWPICSPEHRRYHEVLSSWWLASWHLRSRLRLLFGCLFQFFATKPWTFHLLRSRFLLVAEAWATRNAKLATAPSVTMPSRRVTSHWSRGWCGSPQPSMPSQACPPRWLPSTPRDSIRLLRRTRSANEPCASSYLCTW